MSEPLTGRTCSLPGSGDPLPTFIYGTAWKEDQTARLVGLALAAGFRGVDTANQRKHYHEAGVGEALAKAFAAGTLRREDLFLQTKFTFPGGQDHRLPYDPQAPVATQVRQSLQSSLEHLGVAQLDSFVLHGPTTHEGLADPDREAWRAMEDLQAEGLTRLIGVSNIAIDQLAELFDFAHVRPAFVQNRCFAAMGWDREVREFCSEQGMLYQGFSLLTANRHELAQPGFQALVARIGRPLPQIVFRFAQQIGIIPLTGTTDAEHMRQDLAAYDFRLPDDVVTAMLNGDALPFS